MRPRRCWRDARSGLAGGGSGRTKLGCALRPGGAARACFCFRCPCGRCAAPSRAFSTPVAAPCRHRPCRCEGYRDVGAAGLCAAAEWRCRWAPSAGCRAGGARQSHAERRAAGVSDEMAFRTQPAPVRRVRPVASPFFGRDRGTVQTHPAPIDLAGSMQAFQRNLIEPLRNANGLPIAQTAPANHCAATAYLGCQHLPWQAAGQHEQIAWPVSTARLSMEVVRPSNTAEATVRAEQAWSGDRQVAGGGPYPSTTQQRLRAVLLGALRAALRRWRTEVHIVALSYDHARRPKPITARIEIYHKIKMKHF